MTWSQPSAPSDSDLLSQRSRRGSAKGRDDPLGLGISQFSRPPSGVPPIKPTELSRLLRTPRVGWAATGARASVRLGDARTVVVGVAETGAAHVVVRPHWVHRQL